MTKQADSEFNRLPQGLRHKGTCRSVLPLGVWMRHVIFLHHQSRGYLSAMRGHVLRRARLCAAAACRLPVPKPNAAPSGSCPQPLALSRHCVTNCLVVRVCSLSFVRHTFRQRLKGSSRLHTHPVRRFLDSSASSRALSFFNFAIVEAVRSVRRPDFWRRLVLVT
jgi:hypothetical protein